MQKLLEQFIICINYSGMLDSDIQEIIKETRSYFVEKGFSISTGIANLNGIELNDPREILGNADLNQNLLTKYVFNRKHVDINLTKISLDISVKARLEYEGSKTYEQYIIYIYHTLIHKFEGIIDVSRIGIRKINSLFIRDINLLSNYFKPEIINCFSIKNMLFKTNGLISMAANNTTFKLDDSKINLNSEVQIGEAQEIINETINSFSVYRIILDIDVYWDQEVGELGNNIQGKLNSLSTLATKIYNTCLNEAFRYSLNNNLANTDSNIFGGLK